MNEPVPSRSEIEINKAKHQEETAGCTMIEHGGQWMPDTITVRFNSHEFREEEKKTFNLGPES